MEGGGHIVIGARTGVPPDQNDTVCAIASVVPLVLVGWAFQRVGMLGFLGRLLSHGEGKAS